MSRIVDVEIDREGSECVMSWRSGDVGGTLRISLKGGRSLATILDRVCRGSGADFDDDTVPHALCLKGEIT